MLVVMGEVGLADGALAAVREAIVTMEKATRAEPGCLGYAFSVDVSDPALLRISERWESLDALRAHLASPHMASFGRALAKHPPKSMQLKLYEVARELPLPR